MLDGFNILRNDYQVENDIKGILSIMNFLYLLI